VALDVLVNGNLAIGVRTPWGLYICDRQLPEVLIGNYSCHNRGDWDQAGDRLRFILALELVLDLILDLIPAYTSSHKGAEGR